jgi:HYR domain
MVNRAPMPYALIVPLFLLMAANVAQAQAVTGQTVPVTLSSNQIVAGGNAMVLADITGLNFTNSTIALNWSVASGSCPGFTPPGNSLSFNYASTAPSSNCVFAVSVSDGSDDTGYGTSNTLTIIAGTTPPTITGTPANYVDPTSAASGSGSVENYTLPTAKDQYNASVAVSCSPASGSVFPIGTTTVTCAATDAYGNAALSTTFTVKVNAGATLPAITGTPAGIADTATTSAGAVESWTAPTAADQYGTAVTVSCSPASGSAFPIELTTVVTCTATDSYNHTASTTFPVTISAGATLPAITGTPADITDTATTSAGAVESWTAPTAADQYGTPLNVSCADPSGSLTSGSAFPIGTTTVTCAATDAYHNQGSASFTIKVNPVPTTTVSPINASTNNTAAASNATAETAAPTTVSTVAQTNATAAAVATSAPMTPSASNNYLMAAIVLVAAAALFLVYSRIAKRNSWKGHKKKYRAGNPRRHW